METQILEHFEHIENYILNPIIENNLKALLTDFLNLYNNIEDFENPEILDDEEKEKTFNLFLKIQTITDYLIELRRTENINLTFIF